MKKLKKYKGKSLFASLGFSFQDFISSNLHDAGAITVGASGKETQPVNFTSGCKDEGQDSECAENRYSVLYLRDEQYHHVGCASQAEAQVVMGNMMTDANRIPVGIYDGRTDAFEWEIIGQYFYSQDSPEAQQERLEQVLNVSRVLRRRDSSWEPGYLQRPSFFA
jgi:hypothetical protein